MLALEQPNQSHPIISGHRCERVQTKQIFSRPAQPLGFAAPLIKENTRVIDELLPSLERHFLWRMDLQLCEYWSVDLGHAAKLDCDGLALGRIDFNFGCFGSGATCRYR
jgi:hypothetical protein